jgi:hypothetical protein
MKFFYGLLILPVLVSLSVSAQQTTFQDSLLDHFVGRWILSGTITGKETTHDVAAEWVLGHQYMKFHEMSREKTSSGEPMYEAIVFIGWDQSSNEYACLWLDDTGGSGLTNQIIGRAKRKNDEITFLFKYSDNNLFHTTFLYDRNSDSWRWLMDNEENGKLEPFARLELTRQ